MKKILLVGESWISNATHFKGWDQFSSTTFHLGAEELISSIDSSKFEVEYLTSHDAAKDFPSEIEDLHKYNAIIFSDIGSNTLLLHPNVWIKGETFPNRLKLVKKYVDKLLLVTDDELKQAVLTLLKEEHILTEPSGIAALASLNQIKKINGNKIVLVISGSNISMELLKNLLIKLKV